MLRGREGGEEGGREGGREGEGDGDGRGRGRERETAIYHYMLSDVKPMCGMSGTSTYCVGNRNLS